MTGAPEQAAVAEEREERHGDLGRKFNIGVAWNFASKFSSRIAMFLVTIVLARLLEPKDFGISSIGVMVTGFLVMFAEFGFATALVQRQEVSDADINTTFTLSIVLGAIVGGLCALASPLIADMFHTPEVMWPLRVLSLNMVVSASQMPPRALLYRSLDFRSLAMADVGGSVVYGVTSIGLAIAGLGVWALVFGSLAMSATGSTILYLRAAYRFRPLFDMSSARELTPFGSRMFATNIIEYARGNFDYLVVGRALGPAALGLYTIAFRVADFPRSRLSMLVADVSLPAMSSVQDDQDALRVAFRKAVSTSALLTFPVLVALTIVAPEFVRVVYGEKWLAAVPSLQLLLPMGLLLVMTQPGATLLLAIGKPHLFLRFSVMYAASVLLFTWTGSNWGITGVAWGVLVATIPYFAGFQWMVWRHARIGLLDTARATLAPALGCAVMVLTLLGYRQVVPSSVTPLVWLVGATAVGGVAYGVITLPLLGVRPWARRGESPAEDGSEPVGALSRGRALVERVMSG